MDELSNRRAQTVTRREAPAAFPGLPDHVRPREVDEAIPEASGPAAVKGRDARYRRMLAAADVFAATCALILAFLVLGDKDDLGLALIAAIPLVVVVSKIIGLYDRDEHLLRKTTLDEAPALFQVSTLYTLLIWLGEDVFVNSPGPLGKDQMIGLWVLLFVSLLTSRALARELSRVMTATERCLVLGNAPAARRVGKKLLESQSVNATIIGRVPLTAKDAAPDGVPIVGAMEHLGLVLVEQDVHRVIIAPSDADAGQILDAIRLVKSLGVKVSVLPRLFEVVGSSVRFDDIDGLTLLGVPQFGLTQSSLVLKRCMDLVGSSLALLAFAPLMVAIAAGIKVTSSGPVFFRQTRIGRAGAQFQMLKFRTMIEGADAQKSELLHLNEAEGLFKIANDPRLTSIGRVLRRLSLDELPQLLNVLKGDMSLVGPRPLVADDDRLVEGLHRRRLDVPPGMTGVWQILGSSRVPLNEMVKIDYLYGANWSLWLDAKILLRTVPYMIARRGL
jgi:exopolysaccharide biosynthesis polyprenyl glycosylphosphotransferase